MAGGDTSTPLNLEKRLHLIRDVGDPIRGKRIIDCGCGAGEYVRALGEFGASIVGIEFQKSKLLDAATGRPSRPITLSAADIQKMPFRDGAFELALVNEVLEHVPDDLRGLREVKRVLKPGGLVFVFSPNRLYPFETHGVYSKRSGRRVPHYVPGIPYVPLGIGRSLVPILGTQLLALGAQTARRPSGLRDSFSFVRVADVREHLGASAVDRRTNEFLPSELRQPSGAYPWSAVVRGIADASGASPRRLTRRTSIASRSAARSRPSAAQTSP